MFRIFPIECSGEWRAQLLTSWVGVPQSIRQWFFSDLLAISHSAFPISVLASTSASTQSQIEECCSRWAGSPKSSESSSISQRASQFLEKTGHDQMGLQMWAFEPTPKLLLQMWLEMGQDTASDSIQCREVAGSTRQSSAENRDSASQEPKSSARKSSQAQPEYRPGTCFETTSGTQDGVTHAHGKGWATRRMAIFAVACVTVCVCVMLVWVQSLSSPRRSCQNRCRQRCKPF